MDEVSKKVVKKISAPKKAVKAGAKPRFAKSKPVPAPPPPVALAVPKDSREVPRPLHGPAKTALRIIMEHVYWLGDALTSGDEERAQREVNELGRWARYYRTFAGNPNANKKIEYSSNVEDYGNKKRKPRAGRMTDDEADDSEVDDTADAAL